MDTVMQRENKTDRVVLDGCHADDGARCTLVVFCELNGPWSLCLHGADQLGFRLSKESAVTVAREIRADAE